MSESVESGICRRLRRELSGTPGGRISDIDGEIRSKKGFRGASISRRSNVKDKVDDGGEGILHLETKRSLNSSEAFVAPVP